MAIRRPPRELLDESARELGGATGEFGGLPAAFIRRLERRGLPGSGGFGRPASLPVDFEETPREATACGPGGGLVLVVAPKP